MQENAIGGGNYPDSEPSTNSSSRSDVPLLRELEDGIGAAGQATWKLFHGLPFHGAFLGGAIGLYAATVFGVAELATAGLSAYVTYRMFAYGETFLEALENTIKFEKGELPEEEITKPVPE